MYLALGAMPAHARPDTHLAAGPWCFAGREEQFPGWEHDFRLAPEPLADADAATMAARAAQTLCVRIIPQVAESLDSHWTVLPLIYWQFLLAPWAIEVASHIVEHAMRCQAMRDVWGNESLTVSLMPAGISFDFKDEHDFSLRGSLGLGYNHWLFSRLLEASWPHKWQKEYIAFDGNKAQSTEPSAKIFPCIKGLVQKMLLSLPCPRLKGMTIFRALKYSRALLHSCRPADHSLRLEEAFDYPDAIAQVNLPDTLPVFMAALPQSIKNLCHKPVKAARKPFLRIASIMAYEDAPYRQILAKWRAAGNRLAFVQHGGNYGQVKNACATAFVEYSQDAFFTWGWKTHGHARGNFIPLPYPQLAAIENRWQGGGPALFIGTEMAAYGYRLDSRPTPLQFVAYRQAKADFLANLGGDLCAQTLYRPYFSLPGTLADAPWLLKRFPGLKLCQGNLLPHMLASRLLVLDHHGTTMLEAFAANAPLVLYWNRSHWPLTKEADELLDLLWECGIWHDSPAKAAQKTREIWDDPASWWHSSQIQSARAVFCRRQALLPNGDMDATWRKTLEEM